VAKHISTDSIKQTAKNLGFDLVGITSAEPVDSAYIEHLKKWLADGCHGEMAWLNKNIDKRFNPALLLPEAKSVICTALNYKPAGTSLKSSSAKIASFALYQDYHDFIKNRLFALDDFIKSETGKELKSKICVDSAPLAERALAERAGLGFIGENHLLTNPQIGSFLLLGELITNLPLEIDKPLQKNNFCKDCMRCIDACPTGAISKNGFFDARKCISYLTIEHKGRIPDKLKPKIDSCIFGCDRCIMACPYNEKAPVCRNRDFKFFAERQNISAGQILSFRQKDFDALFGDSAISRSGLRQLKRNALICVKNAERTTE
jgi:epoxyqueuosine reductase